MDGAGELLGEWRHQMRVRERISLYMKGNIRVWANGLTS